MEIVLLLLCVLFLAFGVLSGLCWFLWRDNADLRLRAVAAEQSIRNLAVVLNNVQSQIVPLDLLAVRVAREMAQ